MNGLPRVLQNEIWEYVHGDRAYWRNQFKVQVTPAITTGFTFQKGWKTIQRSALFGPFQIRLMRIGSRKHGMFRVALYKHEFRLAQKECKTSTERKELFRDSVLELEWRWKTSDFAPSPISVLLGLYSPLLSLWEQAVPIVALRYTDVPVRSPGR
jgi:hypothetical protein